MALNPFCRGFLSHGGTPKPSNLLGHVSIETTTVAWRFPILRKPHIIKPPKKQLFNDEAGKNQKNREDWFRINNYVCSFKSPFSEPLCQEVCRSLTLQPALNRFFFGPIGIDKSRESTDLYNHVGFYVCLCVLCMYVTYVWTYVWFLYLHVYICVCVWVLCVCLFTRCSFGNLIIHIFIYLCIHSSE